jgi:hypothetical protein
MRWSRVTLATMDAAATWRERMSPFVNATPGGTSGESSLGADAPTDLPSSTALRLRELNELNERRQPIPRDKSGVRQPYVSDELPSCLALCAEQPGSNATAAPIERPRSNTARSHDAPSRRYARHAARRAASTMPTASISRAEAHPTAKTAHRAIPKKAASLARAVRRFESSTRPRSTATRSASARSSRGTWTQPTTMGPARAPRPASSKPASVRRGGAFARSGSEGKREGAPHGRAAACQPRSARSNAKSSRTLDPLGGPFVGSPPGFLPTSPA